MEIAGLCLPLKPQKDRFCSAISFGCAELNQHLDGVSVWNKKTLFEICSGLDRAVIGEHWISGETDEEKIG
jgi:hypothetical protein